MGIKKFKPTSPGRRFVTVSTFEEITATEPEKSLLKPLGKKGGRNAGGRITVRHRGGGHKRKYRVIDFKRDKDGIPARVATIEYDPNRSARIALLHYADGAKRYILAPNGLKTGQVVESGPEADIKAGNALPLRNIPVGTMIHNIEMHPGAGGQLVRSAGTSAQLKKASTPTYVCPRVKCALCCRTAGPPSARWATWTTKISASAKPVVRAGWAKGPPYAAWL